MRPSLFNTVPEDTRRAALSMYSPTQTYMIIGDQDRSFLDAIDFDTLSISWMESKDILALLSLVTLFQYSERLSDAQTAQATGQRVDWKYALHLPLAYPGIASGTLCMFRQWISKSSESTPTFDTLISHCASLGLSLASPNGLPGFCDVVEVNCLKNCLDLSTNLILSAMEVLASEQPAWLKKVALPHWVSRYMAPHRVLFQAFSREEMQEAIFSLERDMEHLRKVLRQPGNSNMVRYPEIQSLIRSGTGCSSLCHRDLLEGKAPRIHLDCSNCIHSQHAVPFSESFIH